MASLDAAVADFSAAVAADPSTVAPVLGVQRNEVLRFGKSDDPAQDFNLVDLGLLAAGGESSGDSGSRYPRPSI